MRKSHSRSLRRNRNKHLLELNAGQEEGGTRSVGLKEKRVRIKAVEPINEWRRLARRVG